MLRNEKLKLLIGICGNAGHGKDTVGALLANKLSRCYVTSFAGPMKRAAEELFGINPLTSDKDAINPVTGLSVRRTWQLLGTEALRGTFGDGIHVKIADSDIERRSAEVAIFTDVRFENEADYIINNYGTLIHVYDPRKPILSNHVSERFAYQFSGYAKVASHKQQIVQLRNDGSIKDLNDKLDINFLSREVLQQLQEAKERELRLAQETANKLPVTAPTAQVEFTDSDPVHTDEIRRLYGLPPIKA